MLFNFGGSKSKVVDELYQQLCWLLFCHGILNILINTQTALKVKSSTRDKFWGMDLLKTSQIFLNIARVHFKALFGDEEDEEININKLLDAEIYPSIERMYNGSDYERNLLFTSHTLCKIWKAKILSFGKEGLMALKGADRFEQRENLLKSLGIPKIEEISLDEKELRDEEALVFALQRYIKYWIKNGFIKVDNERAEKKKEFKQFKSFERAKKEKSRDDLKSDGASFI